MRSHVYTDARLQRLAGRFVWLEVNGEDERNAAFLERYPVDAWPTLFVIDPSTGEPVVKWVGSARAVQLERMLRDAERSSRAPSTPAATTLARADRLNARGDPAAEAAYREALAQGGERWSRRPHAVESLVMLLSLGPAQDRCAETARAEAPALPRGPAFANAVATGLNCALAMPESDPRRAGLLSGLEALGREGLEVPGLLADDRAGLYEAVASSAKDRGDEAGAHAVAERWWKFLEEEARRARTPESRAALDTSRLSAAVALGDPARALPALQRSDRELPNHLDSPYRLATAYRLTGHPDEALAANDRALKLTSGPRRLYVYLQRATIAQAKGDVALARRALEDGLAFEGRLPPSQRKPRLAQQLQTKLAALAPASAQQAQ